MPFQNSPINQEIIVSLVQSGSLDQVIQQLTRAQAQLEALNKSAQAGATSDEALEKATYEVGAAYDLLAEKIGKATTAAEKNAQAAPWAAKQQQAVRDLIGEMAAYEQQVDALTATELRNYEAVATAATRTGVAVRNANQASAAAAGGASRAILEISRGIEDFATGGFLGILNNIPTTVQAIGQAANLSKGAVAGLTGGISLLATAAFELYTHWDKLEAYFNIGIPRPILDTTEELKNKLREAEKVTDDLGKKTNLSLTELREYKEATARVKEFNEELERRERLEAVLSGKSKAQRERASAFKEAVAESANPLDALDTAIGQNADERGLVFNEFAGKNTAPRELAKRLIDEAAEGDARARDQIVDLLNRAYKPTEGSFASNIVATSPETKAAAKAEKEATEARLKARDEMTRVMDQNEKEATRAQAKVDADRVRVREEFEKNLDQGQKAAARNDAAASARAQRAEQKAVNAADNPYLNPLQDAINRNRMGQLQGDRGAMREADLAGLLQRQVMQRLQGAGQDPRLAHGIVESAFREYGERYNAAFAQTGNREQALISVNQTLMATLAREVQAGARRDAQIRQLMQGANRLQQTLPTLNVH